MKSTTPKIVFTCRFRFAVNNPDNHYKDKSYKDYLENDIEVMTDYYADRKKEIVGMLDYYKGSKQEHLVNLVLENGNYATKEDQEKLKNQMIKATENSNLYKGVVSFDTDWINQTIKIKDLEKIIATEVIPKFLKRCGFKDMKKMRYCFSFHGNTNHLHFHMAFVELEPNYINRDNKILYRRLGMITEEEKNFFKKELLMAIERKSIVKPLITEVNKEIDELKKYFKPGDKNFILKDINNIRLEEKIVKLGFLVKQYRGDSSKKVKYGSIRNNKIGSEIKRLTSEIKKELFSNKNSDLYLKRDKVNNSLKKLNDYYDKLNKENHIEDKVKHNDLVISKEKYTDSYIYNSIINHALFKTNILQNIVKTKNTKDKITLDDLLQELAFEKSLKYKDKDVRLIILNNSLKNKTNVKKYQLNYEIRKAVKNLNDEMEDYANEFHKLFDNQEHSF